MTNGIALICIPHAGGLAMSYSGWKKYLDKHIDLNTVELSGRGSRHSEPFYQSVSEAAADVLGQISNLLDRPYAVYGHSMGALIGYEVVRMIEDENLKRPEHIFISGREAPHLSRVKRGYHRLPSSEFKSILDQYSDGENQYMDHDVTYKYFEKILKNDFRIIDDYEMVHGNHCLDVDMTVISGAADYMKITELLGWKKYTSKKCQFITMEGGHFYMKNKMELFIDMINRTCLERINMVERRSE